MDYLPPRSRLGQSAFRGARIVSVGVPLPDLTIAAVNQHLHLLIRGDLPGGIRRLRLGTVDARRPLIAFAPNGPSVAVGNNVLVLAHLCFTEL